MYKLILVDDEEEVRKGILKKIDWEAYGFEIAGEAENGVEALEIAERVLPDVVITDIKMPFMDGLELSEKLRERLPATKILILTGFDQFEYAHRAIRLNIVEYILKPISSEEIIDMLIKIKEKIDREIEEKNNIDTLKEYYKKSLPLLREKFLGALITRRLSNEEIRDKASTYELNLIGKGFICSVISIDFNRIAINGDNNNQQFGKAADFDNSMNRELIKFAILNISEEVIAKHNSGVAFLHNDYVITIFVSENEDKVALMCKAYSILEEIRQSVERYYNLLVTIGLGTFCNNIIDVTYSYNNAITALDYSIILNNNNIVCIEDMEPQITEGIIFDDMKERSLVSSIKVGTADEMTEVVKCLFEEINDRNTSFKDYQVYLLEMLTAILKASRDLNVDMNRIFGANYNLFVEMYKFKDLNEVRKWLINLCMKIKSFASKERQDASKLIVRKAREYVESEYYDCEITLDKICKRLHISPAYFSAIFKRETKITFINYLTHVRMEAAKQLLRNTDIKTLEIAKRVGYSEPNYFSYCFKKNFNISPSEYRKINKST
jgi:two-component system, response regulator YesN